MAHTRKYAVIISGIIALSMPLSAKLSYADTTPNNISNFLGNSKSVGTSVAENLAQITEGNCNMQGIIRDALFGKFGDLINTAIKNYKSAGDALLKKADDKNFIRRLNMQGFVPMPDIDLSGVTTRADLIRIIAQKSLDTAADLTTARDKDDGDALERAIVDSSQLTRLVLVLIQLPLA